MPNLTNIAAPDRQAALAAYRALNDSPMQRKLRQKKAFFAAVVYWQPGDYDRATLKREFARIREAGFTAVRFHSHRETEIAPGVYDFSRPDDWMSIAAEAGIDVIYHDHPSPSDAMLARHAMTRDDYETSFLDEPRFLAPLEECIAPIIQRYRNHPALFMWAAYGEPGFAGKPMSESEKRAFGRWLEEHYGTIEAVDRAWNIYPQRGKSVIESFDKAYEAVADFAEAEDLIAGAPKNRANYGPARDLMRWHTDRAIARAKAAIAIIRKHDPDHPIAVGSHQLFYNQPMLRWDTGQWARLGDLHFSSIHLSWHFELVKGEVDRPVYMQARMTRDYLKGGWTSAYETTGGAVQYSGGYGNAMSVGLMRRLMLSYLAAGHVNIAFWTWNHRPGGWEGGEYGMTTLSGEVSDWAREAGRIARCMERWRHELWDADPQTRVGLLESWDTQAVYMLEPDLHDLKAAPSKFVRGSRTQANRAYIGAGRAMINHKVAFEHVTAQEILEGIALSYPCIFVPHMRAASAELMEKLADYVQRGGRLVADVQIAFEDQWGKLHRAGAGGPVERAFGAWIDTIHDGRNEPQTVNGIAVDGYFGDIRATGARVLARFDSGKPAITEARLGRGSAVLIGFDAARMCFEPGRGDLESLIASLVTGDGRADWECDAPLAWRLSHQAADHYFLLNDGPARTVFLKAHDHTYSAGRYVIDDSPVDVSGTISIDLPARSGVWVRMQRAA
jgi:beta-galactosidase